MFCSKDLLFSILLATLLSFLASNTFAGDAPLVLSSDGKVNIKQVLQMTPQSSPPPNPVDGDFYYTTNNELLFYTNGEWNMVEFHSHNWEIGNWAACSVSCGGGTQNRSVICRRGDGQQVPDSYCGTKPTTSQACNTMPCIECKYDISGTYSAWAGNYFPPGGFFRSNSQGAWDSIILFSIFNNPPQLFGPDYAGPYITGGYIYTRGDFVKEQSSSLPTGTITTKFYKICRQPQ